MLSTEGASLTGDIPSSIFDISSLTVLRFANNSLSSWDPSNMCNNMPNIKTLSLSRNRLQHHIPPNIQKCEHLQLLDLSSNNLSGTIPREIGNMSMLRELNLRSNHFTGELPQEIGTLPILQYLDVFNNSLSGSIPSSIFNISTLKTLQLSGNEFSGSLPSDMGDSLVNLERLYLSRNKLIGPIPTSITNASKLTLLGINSNSFSGSIPDFGNLRLLQRLYIWGNSLSGAQAPSQELRFLSSLTNCRYLMDLVMSDNPLNGILPTSIGNLSSSLEYIGASNNNIKGAIPSEIGKLSSLLTINLGRNQLSGAIPPKIGKMAKLQELGLSGNQLEGYIPNDLCGMNNLGVLRLGGNMLVGPIPKCLGEIKSLREIYLGSNQLNSTIPPNFWTHRDFLVLNLSKNNFMGQLSYEIGNLKTIYSLDLSFNQFLGGIPSTISGCESLQYLNLSNNLLRGAIPNTLGNVKGLIALDLSFNNLSGLIPDSLEGLPFLEHFSVSNNKLEGEIPDGGRFGNFTAQSFANNFGLCGGPVWFQIQSCLKDEGGVSIKYMIIIPSLSLVVIVAIAMLVLITRRKQKNERRIRNSRRISYIELEPDITSFSETNLLGRGSYGSVYKATLSDGLEVAVKVFDLQIQGAAKSFATETEILCNIRHRNLVRVIGCCSSKEFKALVLTYMPNGSLDKWLHSDMYGLDLIKRLELAIDVAAALEYLHHGYTFPIVHSDVKPSNVLLDQYMVAHLADFGISKLFDGGEAVVQTRTMATIGYAAPELGTEGKVSTSGDVYSFGIMQLEMLTGKKPTDDMFGGEMSLKEWVNEALHENAVMRIVAPALLSREDKHLYQKEQCVSSIFYLAMKCLAFSPYERINMIEVGTTLHKIYATIVASIEQINGV
ncbi:probable LRR receptor-like serine/threonine-protein kinase At3g47570 [Salvia splendens]|uniref:probable LRR receptor-like serine/threonine-protein kinase At3g47570 n=1 Tax=Salvia splendens TaxID=180675 RepID=UPI001C278287|nr:probable LRR receptor-like serine/threonine-protein kinase At3g47570 [Salvia splendens]